MPDPSAVGEAVLEVISPEGSRRLVRVTESPFRIGREETGNHLQLVDRRISRHCAAIVSEAGSYYLQDRGQRFGLFVNGEKTDRRVLKEGDVITFGVADSYQIIFHSSAPGPAIEKLLTRLESATGESSPIGLRKLNLLLQATLLLHSRHPLDFVLGTMLDHAIAVTNAERGLLLEADATGSLHVRLARGTGGGHLSPDSLAPSQTAVRLALRQRSSVVTEDLARADAELQAAQSIVSQQLRSIIAIPLYATSRPRPAGSAPDLTGEELLGLIYLDSRRPAAFSSLDRQILDALAVEAAGVLDNARLVERERERQRLEQELGIARDIQQALLPRGFQDFPHLVASGFHRPSLTVGGDYFDVFPAAEGRTAFLIADVAGKGLGAALLATMLQGAFSGMSIGGDPARIFRHLNRFLCERAEIGRYATMFFGVLDLSGQLEFINAGHPPPLLLRGQDVTEPFTEGSPPVGLIAEADYASARAQLQPGDTIVLFSDGITEAMDPEERMFGVARLREAVAGLGDAPLERIQKAVLESVETFTRGASPADDMTLFLIRYRSPAP